MAEERSGGNGRKTSGRSSASPSVDAQSLAASQAREILAQAIRDLRDAEPAAGERLFFPAGINLIEIGVEIGGAKVSVRIAGDKGTGGGGTRSLSLPTHDFQGLAFEAAADVAISSCVSGFRTAARATW